MIVKNDRMAPYHSSLPSGESETELNPFLAAPVYYGEAQKRLSKVRSTSELKEARERDAATARLHHPGRRYSIDAKPTKSRKFLIPIKETLATLLHREDVDKNMQITIEDFGQKTLPLRTATSNGVNRFDVRGTYALSNLLQELTLAMDHDRATVVIDQARLTENPVQRLERLVRDHFWDGLTRRIDGSNVAKVGLDPKDWTDDPRPRIYVPHRAKEQLEYYTRVAKEHPEMRLDVVLLPENCVESSFVRDLNSAPGLLAVAMEEVVDPSTGKKDLQGLPFCVPGGRFNELYGWDSYMESLGLIANGRVYYAKCMVQHFCFCIEHYGKILNANRSYYLCRSQPPFLTDMALRVYDRIRLEPGALDFLRLAILAAIKEYHSVWMNSPRLDRETGLSRYRPDGLGVPPETEPEHFLQILTPYATKHNMAYEEFVQAYTYGKVIEPELDEYFLHDRAARESGHDTSYRLDGVAADLATVDLNSLLYKYETDIARTIRLHFSDSLQIPAEFCTGDMVPGHVTTSAVWDRRAKNRKIAVDKYLWNEDRGMYFDYNTATKERTTYECATTFWPMWSGMASPRQALSLVEKALPRLESFGGIVSSTEESRGPLSAERPYRQWDYPFGWAPHQILLWVGLQRYGYEEVAQRLAYKWLYIIIKSFVDFNGVVVEKYDVTRPIDPHRVNAEYGNVGSNFQGVVREGFGWVNSSYVLALRIVNTHMKRALGTVTPYDVFAKAVRA